MRLFFVIIALITFNSYGQRTRPFEIPGSDYVVLTYQQYSKTGGGVQSGLKFVNTASGEIKRVEYAANVSVQDVVQVKIDSLQINLVLVITEERPIKNSMYHSETKILTYTPDGMLKNTATVDQDVRNHSINKKTGRLVVVLNETKKGEPDNDQNVIIFDLAKLTRVHTK